MKPIAQRKIKIILWLMLGIVAVIFFRHTIIALCYEAYSHTINHAPLISKDGRYVFFVTQYGYRLTDAGRSAGGWYRYDTHRGLLQEVGENVATHRSRILAISNDGEQVVLGVDDTMTKFMLYHCANRAYTTLTKGQIDQYNFQNGNWVYESTPWSRNARFEVIEDEIVDSKMRVSSTIAIVDHVKKSRFRIAPGSDPIISADGSTVSFLNADRQVMLYAVPEKRLMCVSQSTAGKSNRPCQPFLTLSADGRFILFASQATNLTKIDTPFATDIYLFDRDQKTIRCVSAM
ncbi:MAG TPA: hypothetical protein VHV83_01635 [Armatimonadota bacterium]|nr:hypothetical protein [Armatimonadota bacterium]